MPLASATTAESPPRPDMGAASTAIVSPITPARPGAATGVTAGAGAAVASPNIITRAGADAPVLPGSAAPAEAAATLSLMPTATESTALDQPAHAVSESGPALANVEILPLAAPAPAPAPASAAPSADVPDFGKKKKKKFVPYTFKDRYELTDTILGTGAWSEVRECRSKKTEMVYAAKIIDKKSPRFNRPLILGEIKILQVCKGEDTIIQFEEYFEEDERIILVFEKLHGGPLMDYIKRCKVFTEREASQVLHDIATALAFLHERGIAHRDIKPDNILCVLRDRVSPVKLCDFNLGAARGSPTEEARLTTPVGTPEFMSPEIAEALASRTMQPYDELCDVWSLGVILHIMLTGEPPFSGSCGLDCGWNKGRPCEDCAEDLLDNIARGNVDFSKEVWKPVSGAAKDLIARMLVRAPKRLTARQVLQHPWVCNTPPDTPLSTPAKLSKPAVMQLDTFVAEALEKVRIADTKVEIAAPSNPLFRRRSAQQVMPPFSSVQGRNLIDIGTPRFLMPSPLMRVGSHSSISPGSGLSDSAGEQG